MYTLVFPVCDSAHLCESVLVIRTDLVIEIVVVFDGIGSSSGNYNNSLIYKVAYGCKLRGTVCSQFISLLQSV